MWTKERLHRMRAVAGLPELDDRLAADTVAILEELEAVFAGLSGVAWAEPWTGHQAEPWTGGAGGCRHD